ncbi:hypothetical protein CJ255_15775 [Candidatus Viridilinea mediisalina]|uniref:AIM24 family protein n=2 Tax=Candidatus Viridilinea mediisalina TaxID=2024553 RepID=A0A2A6RGU9_9CHLR|nr:hypothetical protein CJ255_15775 [Candidatus Viridilinea mediisalina]
MTPMTSATGAPNHGELNTTVIARLEGKSSLVEILQYNELRGSEDIRGAQNLFFAQQVGLRLKQVRITLRDSDAIIEAGGLHFMHGNINLDNQVGGLGGFMKKMAANVMTGEATFKPRYRGTGHIYLEPTFGHFLLIRLEGDEAIVEKQMFYAAEGTVDVGVAMQKHISAGAMGGEGWFQTSVRGVGWCVLNSPVPAEEVVRITLNNEKLSVDGTFALLRKGKINFKVEKSTKSLFGTATNGRLRSTASPAN